MSDIGKVVKVIEIVVDPEQKPIPVSIPKEPARIPVESEPEKVEVG